MRPLSSVLCSLLIALCPFVINNSYRGRTFTHLTHTHMFFKQERNWKFIYIFLFVLIGILSVNLPFFWDNILMSSQMATYFYNTNFCSLIVDQSLDVGHPPLFSFYLAIMWKLFGKTLLVSHLAMLPFLIGLSIQLFQLAKKFVSGKYLLLCLVLFLADPTILAQLTMVGLEIVMVLFFVMSVNALLNNKKWILVLCLILLPLLSLRGIIFDIAIFIIDIALGYFVFNRKLFNFRTIAVYVFAGLVALVWYIYHYYQTGWMFFMPSADVASIRRFDSLWGTLRNLLVIGFNLVEYGRIILWISILIFTGILIKRKKIAAFIVETKVPFLLFLIPLVSIPILISLMKNPTGPRYFMVIYIMLILFFVVILQKFEFANPIKKVVVIASILILTTGHFWIFKNISNGWDSSLAHLPYFQARSQMNEYIVKKLPNDTIGTQFPMLESPVITDLTNLSIKSKPFNLDSDTYILYSNISNDFQPNDMKILTRWNLIHQVNNKWINIRLYKRMNE
jgi:hypothetical protein